MLTKVPKSKLLGSVLTFLLRHNEECDDFLSVAVSGETTRVTYDGSESKKKSMEFIKCIEKWITVKFSRS